MEIRHSAQADWDDTVWDAFVAGHPQAHPLQLAAWGRLKSEFGWEAVRLGVATDGRLRAGAQILFRKLPRLGFLPLRVAYVPKGPLVNWEDDSELDLLFSSLHRFCAQRGAILLKVEPEQPDDTTFGRRMRALGLPPQPSYGATSHHGVDGPGPRRGSHPGRDEAKMAV